jgi:ornithine cyclodeaminase
MPATIVLQEAELRRLVPLDLKAVACIEEAFVCLATKTVAMAPPSRLDIAEHKGQVYIKSAYIPGLDGFAVKINPAFFDNPLKGLPSVGGLMLFFRSDTGLVDAVLLDNAYLTNLRTAAAGAVAAKYLAREAAGSAAILGAGVQAHLQLEALSLVRPIRQAYIWSLHHNDAVKAAGELSDKLGFKVTAAENAAEAVAEADIVVTTTPATEPVLQYEWLHPGQHITAMGADAVFKNELDPTILARSVYVADSLAQTREVGELHHAIDKGLIDRGATFPEISGVIAGHAPGRRSPDEITVCDLTGVGVQDTAIAALAVSAAKSSGAGTILDG